MITDKQLWALVDAINADTSTPWNASLEFHKEGTRVIAERGQERLPLVHVNPDSRTGNADGYAAALVTPANSVARRLFSRLALTI